MEITGQDIRRIEFRERLRGYNQSDVDEFLEQVAAAVDRLHEQLRQATRNAGEVTGGPDRGPDTEAVVLHPPVELPRPVTLVAPITPVAPPPAPPVVPPAPPPVSDDMLRRTLELAQRAADMAVDEARQQAGTIVAEAEEMASALLTDAEERDRQLAEQAQAHIRTEVERLESARHQLRDEVDGLTRLVEDERSRARAWLSEVHAALDGLAQRPVVTAEPTTVVTAALPSAPTPPVARDRPDEPDRP